MAMAALRFPMHTACASSPSTSNACVGTRTGIEQTSKSRNVNGCTSILYTPETPGSGRHRTCDAGGAASCCARAGVHGAGMLSRSVEFGRSSSRLTAFQHRLVFPSNASARRQFALRIAAEKPDLQKVARNLYSIGKQGLDTGIKFIPAFVPRPWAQVVVILASLVVGSFFLNYLLTTVTFVVGIGAISYTAYLLITKDDSARSVDKPQSDAEALEEARKIIDKYK